MVEGLEVTIKYRGAKYGQITSPTTPSSEFAILKKDLAHLRVHSPSQKNVRRVDGSFILHWPSAGTSPYVAGLADSLHTRWFKLCSDDPEALKLREFLSIQSITLVQDGVQIRATTGADQPSQDAPPTALAERLGDPVPEVAQQPIPSKRSPPVIAPPRVIPTGPRSDRQPPPHLKRRMSSAEGPSNQTRQKLDTPEVPSTTPPEATDTQPQPPASPRLPTPTPAPADAMPAPPQPTQDDPRPSTPATYARPPAAPEPQTTRTPAPKSSPSREPGEMTPQPILPTPAPAPAAGPSPSTRPPSLTHPARPASPYPSSPSPRRRDRDVNRITRELWDTRRHLTAMQAREQVLLDDLDRLGARPEGISADRNGASRDELTRLEAELRAERARRVRAERALSDVERECKAPFVVPALFQAFMSISELSS